MRSILQDEIRENIERHGLHVMGVFPTKEDPGLMFFYTVGNHLKKLPELLMIGELPGDFACRLMNMLSEKMVERGARFADGELVDIGAKCALKVVMARDPRAYDDFTIQAMAYYDSRDYEVMQVLIPDPEGRFPDEPNCAAPYGGVPVLTSDRSLN